MKNAIKIFYADNADCQYELLRLDQRINRC